MDYRGSTPLPSAFNMEGTLTLGAVVSITSLIRILKSTLTIGSLLGKIHLAPTCKLLIVCRGLVCQTQSNCVIKLGGSLDNRLSPSEPGVTGANPVVSCGMRSSVSRAPSGSNTHFLCRHLIRPHATVVQCRDKRLRSVRVQVQILPVVHWFSVVSSEFSVYEPYN